MYNNNENIITNSLLEDVFQFKNQPLYMPSTIMKVNYKQASLLFLYLVFILYFQKSQLIFISAKQISFYKILMIRISLLNKYKNKVTQEIALITEIESQLQRIHFDLSDQECWFYINHYKMERNGDNYIIDMYFVPLVGQFQGIQFRPKAFFSLSNIVKRPKIYNNFRVFHPNIDMYTCEIIFKKVKSQWNPATGIIDLLNCLKKVLLRPNVNFVPNNQFNRRAAWNYQYNKKQYRDLILENHPDYLEEWVNQEFKKETSQIINKQKCIQSQNECDFTEEFWSLPRVNIPRAQKNKCKEECQLQASNMEAVIFELIELPLIQSYFSENLSIKNELMECNM